MSSDKISGKSNISRLDWKLWKEYLEIAQEFWLPKELQKKRRFILLIGLMMFFCSSILFVAMVAFSKITHHYSPEFLEKIAPGLYVWVNSLMHSWVLPFFITAFILPIIVFTYYSKKLAAFFTPWIILAILLFLAFTVSGVNVIISYVGRFFQTALAGKDVSTFWRFFFIYLVVIVSAVPIIAIYSYIQKRLGLFWREWITNNFMDQYLKNRAYYELTANKLIDNPDQRIAQDLKEFTATSLGFLLILLGAVIDLFAFSGILWSISRMLTGVLFAYAISGTLITYFIGKRLVGLNFNQLRKEADFRYGLIHLRDNAESIAFYQGEKREKIQLAKRFKSALRNFNFLIGWQRNLDFFTNYYRYLIMVLPAAVVAPMFFRGEIEFGEIAQASSAFAQVLGAFSIIVSYFDSISAFAAGINRVSTFKETLDKASGARVVGPNRDEKISRCEGDTIKLSKLTLKTPDYARTLVTDLSLDLASAKSILIVGHSGVGKSSLLRGIAGLWDSGTGEVSHPSFDDVMFLPQKPYMILGTFRDQLQYPSGVELSKSEIEDVLAEVNLKEVFDKMQDSLPSEVNLLDIEQNWDEVLSQGEQQRLAFARLLISKPKFAILDEATSALDVGNEKKLYDKLTSLGINYISVGHRPTLKLYHSKILFVEGEGKWSLHEAADYDFMKE